MPIIFVVMYLWCK